MLAREDLEDSRHTFWNATIIDLCKEDRVKIGALYKQLLIVTQERDELLSILEQRDQEIDFLRQSLE